MKKDTKSLILAIFIVAIIVMGICACFVFTVPNVQKHKQQVGSKVLTEKMFK